MIMKYKDFEITGSPEDICYVIDHIQYETLKNTRVIDCSQMTSDDFVAINETFRAINETLNNIVANPKSIKRSAGVE